MTKTKPRPKITPTEIHGERENCEKAWRAKLEMRSEGR